MENITLGQISLALAFLITLIGGIISLVKYCKKLFDKVITKPIIEKLDKNKKELENKINDIESKINVVGADQCKNYLVRYLADVENNEELSEVETQRAYDAYEKYTNIYHGNSYIHARWDKIMRKKERKV